MEPSDSNESDRYEKQMSQNTNSNSASVIVVTILSKLIYV